MQWANKTKKTLNHDSPLPTPHHRTDIHTKNTRRWTFKHARWRTVPQLVKKIPCNLWDPKVHYRIHNSPPPLPILSPHPTSWSNVLILSFHLRLGLLSLKSPNQNPRTHHPSPPYVLHVPPISFFMIWSYLVKSTDHKSRYVVFSIALLPRPS